ncbi:response regulator [Chitinophaga horti]|uniref:Response regulator n=1 Tax=Chitinophaga horti TaxID=2920382 RepID=A0ABY6J4D7_9BACT|nr:response regulator [Chitinophaga horti]UYQ94536.1 response regulator [Chitinophaga horti]
MAQKFTCVLIDDDADDQEIFLYALKQIGENIECLVFDNGKEAIANLGDRAILPDYIFLDLNMPSMDGRQCLRAIKQLPHLDETPVIIYSTSSAPRDKQETAQMGARGYVEKQPSLSLLVAKLENYFKHDQDGHLQPGLHQNTH